MAEKNKSIIESALLDAKRIQEALNANTKEILRSVAIEEIDGLVKESLEEGYFEEDAEETDVVSDDENTEEIEGDETPEDEESEESEEIEGFGGDDLESSMKGDGLEGDDDISMSADALAGSDEVNDMTKASMDDVIKVYKELTGDDEIEVVFDDETGDIKLSVNQPGTYVVKTEAGNVEVSDDDEIEVDGFEDESDEDESDEVMYEIALEEMEDIDGKKAIAGGAEEFGAGFDGDAVKYAHAEGEMVMSEGDDVNEGGYTGEYDANMAEYCKTNPNDAECKEDLEETIAGKRRADSFPGKKSGDIHLGYKNESRKPTTTINEVANKYNTLLTETKELRGRNEEYKQALKQFRTMLAETVVFNSNLTYVTKLFMEHSTTKEEKQGILKRFDNEVSTLKESKKLYKSIVSEITSRKTMNESIDRKLNNEVSSSMSKQLNESTAYIDKETQRIKDLMSRVEKR